MKNLGTFTFFWLIYLGKLAFLGFLKYLRRGYGKQNRFKSLYTKVFKNVLFTELFLIGLEGYFQSNISTGMDYDDKNRKGLWLVVVLTIINLIIIPMGLINSIWNHINIY